MLRRLLIVCVLLLPLVGCEDGGHKLFTRELGIKDLRLSATISSDTVVRGDTLDIRLVARNPYRGPVDALFPSSCREAFWVYNDQGQDVTPGYACLEMPSTFHMGPLEVREFDLRWRACGDVRPGRYTVVAGFHALINDTPHTTVPIPVEVLGREEDVTGTWAGTCFDFYGIPGWMDYHISLTLHQSGMMVTGTLKAGGPEYQINSGFILGTELNLAIVFEPEDLRLEFTGDVCGDGMRGSRQIRRISTGELVDSQLWHVERTK